MKATYSPRALRDLQAIAGYLGEQSPGGAKKVLAAIKSTVGALEAFPSIGCLASDAGHRRIPVGRNPYLVFYRIADDEILILQPLRDSQVGTLPRCAPAV